MSVCQLILSKLHCFKRAYNALCYNSEVRISMFRAEYVIQSTPKLELQLRKSGSFHSPEFRVQYSWP